MFCAGRGRRRPRPRIRKTVNLTSQLHVCPDRAKSLVAAPMSAYKRYTSHELCRCQMPNVKTTYHGYDVHSLSKRLTLLDTIASTRLFATNHSREFDPHTSTNKNPTLSRYKYKRCLFRRHCMHTVLLRSICYGAVASTLSRCEDIRLSQSKSLLVQIPNKLVFSCLVSVRVVTQPCISDHTTLKRGFRYTIALELSSGVAASNPLHSTV